jgi:hypothetical protein
MLHEHETALSAASHANRSRRLIKCAKESARYPDESRVLSLDRLTANSDQESGGAPSRGVVENHAHARQHFFSLLPLTSGPTRAVS